MMKLSRGLMMEWIGGDDSLKAILDGGVLGLFTTSPPADPNSAEPGSLVALLTLSGGAFTADTGAGSTNGLTFGTPTYNSDTGLITMGKTPGELWQGNALIDGVIGWGRYYGPAYTTGATDVGMHFDGIAGVSSGEIRLSATRATAGVPIICTGLNIKLYNYRR